MEPRKTPPEYTLEIFADITTVRDVLKGILNLIFFHRYFPSTCPSTFDVLDLTLPAITDADLETLIDSRVSALVRQHLSSPASANANTNTNTNTDVNTTATTSATNPATGDTSAGASASATGGGIGGGGVRGRIAVEFYEKKRRRSGLWFGALAGKSGEEEVCWEVWSLDVTIATPRTETERAKVRKAMESMLHKSALKILSVVNRDKDHIPPITTSESNPFPYRIVLNPRSDSWGNRIGLY